jgi:membrane protein required for colicin V production
MSQLPITAVDIAVLLVLLISAIAAFARGFVHEVLSIGAWVGAGLATLYLFGTVQPHSRELIPIPLLADIAAGVAIFLACLIVLAVLTRMLTARVKNSALGALDRSLGLAFGVLRGAVIIALAWLVLVWALPDPAERPDWIREAKSRRLVEASATMLAGILPGDLGERARRAADGDADWESGEAPKDMESVAQPDTKAPERDPKSGYTQEETSQMDSLIEGQTYSSESGESEK